MQLGDLVIVTAKFNNKIREQEKRIGTLVQKDDKQAWVMFDDGTMWIGDVKLVFPNKEHE